MATIDEVRDFWNQCPLFTEESAFTPGSRQFFEDHTRTYFSDCFAGRPSSAVALGDLSWAKLLDVGCGIGFWPVLAWQAGCRNITAVDISSRSIELAKRRCQLFGVTANIQLANAERLPFAANAFDVVVSHGVIHHTPSPKAAASEIHRVLRPGGTAQISVYYKNAVIRAWPALRHILRFAPIGLKGRGRSDLSQYADANEIVRRYDGAENPLGIAYTEAEFAALLSPLRIVEIGYYFFPARALPISIPRSVHRMMQGILPFMIAAKCTKD